MGEWAIRAVLCAIAIILLILTINFISDFTAHCVDLMHNSIYNTFDSIGQPGGAGIKSALKLCLWLVALLFIARFFFSRRG